MKAIKLDCKAKTIEMIEIGVGIDGIYKALGVDL